MNSSSLWRSKPGGQAADSAQLLERFRLRLGELQQGLVADEPLRRMIDRTAPVHRAGCRARAGLRFPRLSSELGRKRAQKPAGVEVLRFQLEAGDILEVLIGLLRGGRRRSIRRARQRAGGEQVTRVHLGVSPVAGGQGAARPIGLLMLLAPWRMPSRSSSMLPKPMR